MKAIEEASARPAATWWVYVLTAQRARRTYVGVTLDLERRLRQHNGSLRGGASHTRAHRPWKIAKVFGPYPGRSRAQSIEVRIKRSKGSARLNFVDERVDTARSQPSRTRASHKRNVAPIPTKDSARRSRSSPV